jgi:hypothetical protein
MGVGARSTWLVGASAAWGGDHVVRVPNLKIFAEVAR